jgi:hypothetical protein
VRAKGLSTQARSGAFGIYICSVVRLPIALPELLQKLPKSDLKF